MKRSEALIKLQRYYTQKHPMVECGHITKDEFMANVLELIEEMGMLPPFSRDMVEEGDGNGMTGFQWEKE